MKETSNKSNIQTSITPWLSVQNSRKAVEFYKTTFGAVEVYHMDGEDDSVVSRLSINGAEFWVSEGISNNTNNEEPAIRMILTYAKPDELFTKVIAAGATEIFPVDEGHGWRLGRLVDPYGIHWEIGYELSSES